MKTDRLELTRMFVLDVVADDYESLDKIFEEVLSFSALCGLGLTRREIETALSSLIADGLIKVFLLSFSAPVHEILGIPERGDLDKYYYWVSEKGRELQLADYPGWPFDEEGNVVAGWTCPED